MTTPTTNQVPSSDPRDLLFNAEALDKAVNDSALSFIDRKGALRKTVAGAIDSIAAVNVRGAWVTATSYALKDVVTSGGIAYICIVAHTSGASFASDLAAKWRVHQGVLASDLAEDNPVKAAALVTLPTEFTDEQATSVFSILKSRARVKRFWVSGDGADWKSAFRKAAASGARRIIVEGDTVYSVSDQIDLLSNQDWEFENVDIQLTDDTKRLFSSIGGSDWSIRGMARVAGNLVTSSTTGECGLYIENGKRYVVENFQARNFKGNGIHLAGSSAGALRGDRGQLIGVSAFQCMKGAAVDAGAGAEYNDWVAPHFSGCSIGMEQAAGNNVVIGGTIVDNTTGVRLLAGANHCHGGFYGTAINHSATYNLHATSVTNGHTFSGVHFYGNGGSTGAIYLQGCKGILIADGIIDCWVYNDTGAGSGANRIEGNYLPGDYGVTLASTNGGLPQLFVRGNYGPSGPSQLNDAAPIAALVARSTNQSLAPAGTAVKAAWDSESIDNRGIHSAGDFTVPAGLGTQLYEISADVYVTASSGIASGGFVEVRVNGAARATWPLTSINGTNGSVGGDSTLMPLSSGDIVTLWITANTGSASPVLAATQSRMSIMLRG